MHDRNLLFGILALQMDFITRDALVDAMREWIKDKSKSLGKILVSVGHLERETRDVHESLVDHHIKVHGGQADKILASLTAAESMREFDYLARKAAATPFVLRGHESALSCVACCDRRGRREVTWHDAQRGCDCQVQNP